MIRQTPFIFPSAQPSFFTLLHRTGPKFKGSQKPEGKVQRTMIHDSSALGIIGVSPLEEALRVESPWKHNSRLPEYSRGGGGGDVIFFLKHHKKMRFSCLKCKESRFTVVTAREVSLARNCIVKPTSDN